MACQGQPLAKDSYWLSRTASDRSEPAVARGDDLLRQVRDLTDHALAILAAAEADGDRAMRWARSAKRGGVLNCWRRWAGQIALIREARRSGLPIHELVPDADRLSRALPAAVRMEGGGVAWPADAPWRDTLEEELLSFRMAGRMAASDVPRLRRC